mgnify:CR=1 FL=1
MTVKSCEKLEKSRVALTIEASAEEFEAAVNKAYLKMRGKINVPGFRVGKAPRKIIEKMYGEEVFYEEAVNIILPDAYEDAVKEQGLETVGYPQVELESCTKDGVVFKCTVAVYPEVKLGQYKGLEAPKAEVKVAAADVNARLKEMADRNSTSSKARWAASVRSAVIFFLMSAFSSFRVSNSDTSFKQSDGPAAEQVKMDLATAAIIKAENIEASDEDVEAEFAKMAEQFGMDVEMVKKYLSKEQVHDQILTQKAVAVVVDSATAEKPAKKTAKKAETAEGEEKKPAKKTTKKAETAEGEEKPKKAPAKKAAKKEEKEAE